MPGAPLAAAVRTILLAVAAALATATVLFHGLSLAGVSFGVQAPVAALSSAAAAAAVLRCGLRGLGPGLRTERREALCLAAMCVATGLLLLAVQHATSDDSHYLPPVQRCLADPGRVPAMFDFLWFGAPEPPPARWALPVPFDMLEGAFTHVTGVPLPWTRYVVAPFLLAGLVPAAWFLLLSRLGFRTAPALAGVLLGGAALLLMREQPEAPCSVLLLFIYQAKYFALSVLFPLFAAIALEYLGEPTRGRWIALFAVATASAGCNLSSVLLQSLLAPVLAAAGFAAWPGAWRRCLALLPAAAYPLLVAAWVQGDARASFSPSSPAYMGRDPTFAGHLLRVFGGPVTATLALGAFVAAPALLRGVQRRFLAAWTGAVLLLLYNPWVGPFVIEHVTSTDLYWRIAFLLPLAPALGVPGAAWAERRARAPLLAAAALLLLQVPFQALGLGARTQLVHPLMNPDRCFNRLVAADARWIAATAPPGPVLAPQYLSTILAILGPDHPVVVHWPGAMRLAFARAGLGDEANLRGSAGRALQAWGESRRGDLRTLLRRRPGIATVVLYPEALAPPGLEELLAEEGFRPRATAPSGLRMYRR